MLHAIFEILADVILEVLVEGLVFVFRWINES